MKFKLALMGLLVGVVVTGCTIHNPNAGQPVYDPTTGVTNIAPATLVDTQKIASIDQQLKGVLDKATQVNSATAAFNPYAVPVQAGIDVAKTVEIAIPSVAAGISALVAFFQNRGKKVQTAAAAQLAKSPTNEHAIANAPTQAVADAIAIHSANAQDVIPAPIPTTKVL